MRMRLNDLTIRRLKTEAVQADFWDSTLPGFGVRVSRRGTKTFILKQANKRYTLGRFLPPYFTLKHAKDEARRRMALKYLPPATVSAQQLVSMYLAARRLDLRWTSYGRIERLLTSYLPDQPIGTITGAQIHAALLPLGPAHRNMAFSFFKTFLNWCVEQGHLAKNPIAGVKLPHKRKPRTRLLTDAEINSIWAESFNHDTFGSILRALILSGQRRTQITHFDPSWIRGDTVVFPGAVMKTNEEHTIPVTPRLLAHLPNSVQPFKSSSTAMAKFRAGLNTRIVLEVSSRNGAGARTANAGIPHFTLHDFRRYFASTMAKLGVPIDITEALLSHKTGSRSPIQRTYDVYSRLEPMRKALTMYEQHLSTFCEDLNTAEHQ
jgi:integrase